MSPSDRGYAAARKLSLAIKRHCCRTHIAPVPLAVSEFMDRFSCRQESPSYEALRGIRGEAKGKPQSEFYLRADRTRPAPFLRSTLFPLFIPPRETVERPDQETSD